MTAREIFLEAFSKVIGTGDFHSTGAAPFFFPKLEVDGLGELEDGYSYGRRGRYGRDEAPEDGTMGEIYEEGLTVANWRNAADRSVALGTYHIEADAVISGGKINEGEPDEKEAEGFTGNEGCTIEYWYRRAAVVLWAKKDQDLLDLISQ
jgi:hypothetical protein